MTDAVPEPPEVTLADLVGILWRRRGVLLASFLLCVSGGVAYTLLQAPQYTSQATIVAVDQQDVIRRWLDSQQAAAWVGEQLGAPVETALFPDTDASSDGLGQAIAARTEIAIAALGSSIDRSITITVEFPDAGLASDIANSFVDSLEVILPQLQSVTESQLFAQFYDGQNAEDARRQAHEVAVEREYWIVVDPAYAAASPSSPNVTLNIALSVVLGCLLGVMAAFTWQWAANYRASAKAPVVPPGVAPDGPRDGVFRYRGP